MSAADWKPYDVPGLAGLLAEQPTDSGTHAMAWQQAYETLTDQRQRIEAARAALTEAWPATPGSAAGSFFDQVDALTQAMSATAESAVNAHGALTGIVTAVDGATTKVDTLHQSWQQNQATIGDVVPADDWTQPLNDQAHTVMGQADAAIAEHATLLAPPVPYSPVSRSDTYTPLGSPPRAPGNGRLTPRPGHNPTTANGGSDDASTLAKGTSVQGGIDSATVLTRERGNGSPQVALTSAQSGAAIGPLDTSSGRGTGRVSNAPSDLFNDAGRTGLNTDLSHKGLGSGGVASAIADEGSSRITGPRSARARMNRAGSLRTEEPMGANPQVIRGNANAGYVPEAVSTDGTVATVGSQGAVPETDTSAIVGEPMPGSGFLATGSGAPVSQNGVRRYPSSWEETRWPMPVGVRPIIEAPDDIAISHDPGTGVIGIDL